MTTHTSGMFFKRLSENYTEFKSFPPQVYEIGYRQADKVEQQGKQKGPTQERPRVLEK